MEAQPDEELVGSNANSRNWKGIAISLLVICIVCSLIVIAVIVKRPNKSSIIEQKPFSMDDIMHKSFEPRRFSGSWISNKKFAYLTDNLNVVVFDCEIMQESIVLSNYTVKQLVGDKFKFFMTNDPAVFLLAYDMRNLFRHSIISRYKLFNTINNLSFDVVPPELDNTDQIQNAILSPNGRQLAFVYQNNIYLMSKFFDGQKDSIKITSDGLDWVIYNGIADWLYEEEIFGHSNAIWWSPDSKKFAYIRFDDSAVRVFAFPVYDGSPYEHLNKVRYPKPGTHNPTATVHIYDSFIGNTVNVTVPKALATMQFYVWNVKWFSNDSLIIVYVNRKQNKAFTVINDANTGNILSFKEYPSAPLTNYDAWFLPTGLLSSYRYNYYFQIWPSEGYKNIISFDTRNGDAFPITNEKYDITDILSLNEKTGELFYLATDGDPRQRHLFKKKITDHNAKSECLTCNRSVEIPYEEPAKNKKLIGSSEHCLYHSASFSPNGDYYVLECLGEKMPITYIRSTVNTSVDFEFEKNEELRQIVGSRILPTKSYLRVYLDNSTNAYSDAEILFPPNFDTSEAMFPVLVYVYNGPASQTVDFQFRIRKFETFLCINFGVIVVVMDGRGTDANGDKYLKAVSKRLGEVESEDQITLANTLRRETFIDDDRLSIWGWSYGGFLSAWALLDQKSPFKCAVSGAPVSDWLLYDSAYTERYLGLYSENRQAYERSNLTHFAKLNSGHLNRKRMLLIHGTGDDNVHFQNSAILAKILRNTKLEFDFEVYPDVQHTPDEETQRHLYQRISKFLLGCYNINYQHYLEQLNYHHLMGEAPSLIVPAHGDDKEE